MPKSEYNPREIEKKWQKKWGEEGVFTASDKPPRPRLRKEGKTPTRRGKQYILDMFPYPSGDGLHVGHVKGYIATDVYARYKRMQGFEVLHPMGWDAFGLPAENYALANKVHPRAAVEKNIARFKEQLNRIGFSYDWEREINTTDHKYYKWTQWIFLQMFKKGLAYESNEPINWCPNDKTGLANEDIEDGRCERCGTPVEKKPLRQWVLRIRDYADKLLAGLDDIEWPESIKTSQRNWIGRSEGALLKFQIPNSKLQIEVFTTRADTLFGATYLVLAPEHPIVAVLLNSKFQIPNSKEVADYVRAAEHKTDAMRQTDDKDKTGVEIKGVVAINPANNEEIPIWVADYVLMSYGTGAIMAVPAHDERDFAFARKFNLPVRCVIDPLPAFAAELGDSLVDADAKSKAKIESIVAGRSVYDGPGRLMNSGAFDGMEGQEAKRKIVEKIGGETKVMYKLRDWVFSRQRYWGEPIPLIHCEKCGVVPVPEEELPVELPEVENYEPTGTGASPLAAIEEWVNLDCPRCGGPAMRETNTMPQWAGSCWYYLRYIDPNNDAAVVDPEKEAAWMPVDMYVGGAEHATRHLIYARFWHKFLYDEGVVTSVEPFYQLKNVGLILGADGRKMSKRWGNVLNPDDVVEKHGADALRMYEMFMGPFENAMAWSEESLVGAARFLKRVHALFAREESRSPQPSHPPAGGATAGAENLESSTDDGDARLMMHRTIKRVTEAIENFRFNTGVAAMMEWLNELEGSDVVSREEAGVFVRLLSPYAPHLAEELWEGRGEGGLVLLAGWPQHDAAVLQGAEVTVPVQVNGKVRGEVSVAKTTSEVEAFAKAQGVPNVRKYLSGKQIVKRVYVAGRMINLVVR